MSLLGCALITSSPEFLNDIINAHGGLEQWEKIASIQIRYSFSGAVLNIKGHPGHHNVTLTLDTTAQKAVIEGLDGNNYRRIYTPSKTVVERLDPTSPSDVRESPRSSFAGHERVTPWDQHHLTYFVGYTMWYYLNVPFCFVLPGFKTREINAHEENGETWRVLEATFPASIVTHSTIQRFYYDKKFQLRRMDYVAEVIGPIPIAHYCYDYKVFSGISMPVLRRVVPAPLGLSGPTSFLVDISDVNIAFKDGSKCEGRTSQTQCCDGPIPT
jgi:hypothetical protein